MRKRKTSKPSDIITDYQEKQMNNLNKSIQETADTSKSFLGPMILIILVLVAVFSCYYAVSRVGQKSLKVKLQEIAYYVENNTPSWRSLRLLGYQQEASQITQGYLYNSYFSVVDVVNLPNDVDLSEWRTENFGKLYGRVVISIDNGDYIYDLANDNSLIDLYNNRYTTTLRINGTSINCVRFYGLTPGYEGDLYNPYSQYGEVYIPVGFISDPDDYVDSVVPVYTLTGDLVSPTYSEDSISSIFSGFRLISNVALTGVEFIQYCLGLIWVIFT